MSRIAYVNGRYLPHANAAVHIEDRGYQFADGVYEVLEVRDGRLLDVTRHFARLGRSRDELRIGAPVTDAALRIIVDEVVRRNRVHDGIVYIQVTRGVATRDHAFPVGAVRPSLIVTSRPMAWSGRAARAQSGIRVVTVPDIRWARVDIKSISLLPNVLAKQAAKEAGAAEAWFVAADETITEGASTNAWIITADNRLLTAPGDHGILRGVTRSIVMDVAAQRGLTFEERPFSLQEAYAATEAFLTSRTSSITPVVQIDDQVIGNGRPGAATLELREAVLAASEGLEP